LHINIKDNGKGFLVSRENNLIGMGLLNIHHRIQLMNGRIIIQSEPGIGTNLHIEVPLNS
jgi:signal transduction histidine kinase